MALKLSDRYPGRTDATANYPHGKPRNATSPGDGTGFPLESDWVSDIYGFLQSLLVEASIVPSTLADRVGASQYLDALDARFSRQIHTPRVQLGWFAVSGAASDENLLTVTKRGDLGGTFGVAANRVEVPSAGTYLALLRAELQYASPGDRSHYGALLNVAGSGQLWGGRARGVRFSGASVDAIGVLGLGVIGITDHTTDTIGVAASAPGGGALTVNAVTGSPDPCLLLLLRVSPAA